MNCWQAKSNPRKDIPKTASTRCEARVVGNRGANKKPWPVDLVLPTEINCSPTNVELAGLSIADGPIETPASTLKSNDQASFSASVGIVTFNLKQPLGAGNDGTVYGGSLTKVGLDVDQKIAIKLLKEFSSDLTTIESNLAGSSNLLTNIATGRVIHREVPRSYMVYPLMPHALNTDGGRKQALERDNGLKATMTDACTALVHMHDKSICHRDITLDNLFVDSKNRVVVGDFGAARHLLSTDTVPIKTKEYMQTWLSLQLSSTTNVGQKRSYCEVDQPQVNGWQFDVMMLGMTLTMLIAGVTFNRETFYFDGMGTFFDPLFESINQSGSGPDSEFKLQPNRALMANSYHSDLVNDSINAMVHRHGMPATRAALDALKAMVTGTVSATDALKMAQDIPG